MPAKKTNNYSLREAIDELLKNYQLEGKMNEVKVINGWEKIMGGVISKYTRRLYIENRILHAEISSPALRAELSYGRSRIVQLLNDEAGTRVIDDVVFH